MSRRPTSNDVARLAGVSNATVSYVLNNTPGKKLTAATRERVLRAVDELGYRPQTAARTLRKGSSDVVALLLPDWPIGARIARTIEILAHRLGPNGFYLSVLPNTAGVESVRHIAQSLSPAALIVYDIDEHAEGMPTGVPIIAASKGAPGSLGWHRSQLQVRVGYVQMQHLLDRGHRKIAFVTSQDENAVSNIELRRSGVQQASADAEAPAPILLEMSTNSASAAETVRAALAEGITALCAYNDVNAIALLGEAIRMGVSVPSELAIIGVDATRESEFAVPRLTTVAWDMELVVSEMADAVLALIAGEPFAPSDYREMPYVIARETT